MRPATTSESLDFLLTVKEIADLLAVSEREVWRMAAAGELPKPKKLSHRKTRWKGSEIQAYLDSLRSAES